MDTKNTIIWNPKEIRIPPHTLIVLCGIANSGKTTFAKRNFGNSINTDVVLENLIDQLIEITKADLSITSQSPIWDEISTHLGRVAMLQAQQIAKNMLIQSSETSSITVFDSISVEYEQRMKAIEVFSPYFEQVYLCVIHPSLEDVMKRTPKEISENSKSLGFYYPDSKVAPKEHFIIKNQISSGSIGDMVDKTFIFTDLDYPVEILFRD